MRLLMLIVWSCLSLGMTAPVPHHAEQEFLYVGSFADRGSEGLYVFRFDRTTGRLSRVQTLSDGKSPNFLAISPDKKHLYAIYDRGEEGKGGNVTAYQIDPANGMLEKLNEQPCGGRGPAHVSVDPLGRFVYVSNYGSGTLAVYPIEEDGRLAEASQVIQDKGSGPHPNQKGPHVHSAIPSRDGKFLYVCDLGIDKVLIYRVGEDGKLTETSAFTSRPGAGPRQFAIAPDGQSAYLVEELISNLVSFSRDSATGALTAGQHFAMLPEGYEEQGSDATVFVSPDNRFVYATNWGPKGISVYRIGDPGKLTLVQHADVHGAHPRDICIDQKGQYVFVANMGSDELSVLKRDASTGILTYSGEHAEVPAVSCIVQLFLP